jgi:hypothetical protein
VDLLCVATVTTLKQFWRPSREYIPKEGGGDV